MWSKVVTKDTKHKALELLEKEESMRFPESAEAVATYLASLISTIIWVGFNGCKISTRPFFCYLYLLGKKQGGDCKMFRFLCYKNLLHDVRIQFLLNSFRKCHYQTNPPSSLIEYLQTSLGFSAERALTISQQVKCRNPKNPDSVLTFFKSHGFSETHVKSIINRVPSFLFSRSHESRFKLEIQFFKEKGISESVLVDLMVSNPHFFTYCLGGHKELVFNLLSSVLGTDEFTAQLLIWTKLKFNPHILSMNLTIPRNCSIKNHHVSKLFKKQPQALGTKSDCFNDVVEMVKGMRFKPQMRLFVEAVFTILGMSRQTWDAKFKVYTSLGLLDDEILLLFCRHPTCMRL